jgi:hypothetical protein
MKGKEGGGGGSRHWNKGWTAATGRHAAIMKTSQCQGKVEVEEERKPEPTYKQGVNDELGVDGVQCSHALLHIGNHSLIGAVADVGNDDVGGLFVDTNVGEGLREG